MTKEVAAMTVEVVAMTLEVVVMAVEVVEEVMMVEVLAIAEVIQVVSLLNWCCVDMSGKQIWYQSRSCLPATVNPLVEGI